VAANPVDIVDSLARCFVAVESSFASGGTDVNAFPVAGSIKPTRTYGVLPVRTLHVRNNDVRDGVKVFKGGNVKFTYLLQPSTTVMGPSSVVPTGASEPPLWVLLKVLFGGQSVAPGMDVVASPSPTSSGASVTPAGGANFPSGQLALIADTTDGLQPVVIRSRAVDALTWWPAMTGAPATGADVVCLPTWYMTRTNSKSLRMRIANAQDANYQWEFLGGTMPSLELKLAKGELAMADFDFVFAKHTGPSAQGLSRSSVADSMDTPLACRDAVCYIQASGTTTRVNYPIEAASVKWNLGNKHMETLSGGTEGIRGVARTEGLQDTQCMIELDFRADSNIESWFSAFTHVSVMLYIPVDTATGRRVIVVYAGKAWIQEQPVFSPGPGDLLKVKATFQCQLNDTYTDTPDNEELAQAGAVLAIG
jgi:hypothetical protein